MQVAALHEFMATNRGEILDHSIAKMASTASGRSREDLATDFASFVDDVIRALQREAGLPAASELPGKSESAKRFGGRRHERAYAIELLPLHLGSVSDTVGEIAARQGLSFPAGEYRMFNLCIDSASSAAIEEFANQERRRSDDATTQRVGFLAHELRNALSSGRMAFTLLRQGQIGINSKTGDTVDRSFRRLDGLISQTLVAVHLQAGVELVRRRLRVIDLLRDVEDVVVAERGIRLHVEAAEELEIEADERLLVSAVSNLVQNAFKFTKVGGHVSVRARRERASIVIEVEDECGGLPPGKEQELFAPFVQRGHNRRGLGLGLPITREAVAAHGGALSVQNLPGKGCVFEITLPALIL